MSMMSGCDSNDMYYYNSLLNSCTFPHLITLSLCPTQKDDANMNEIIHQAHRFLQNFCRGNPANQKLLHENLSLFMQSGENASSVYSCGENMQGCSVGGYCTTKNMKLQKSRVFSLVGF